MNDKGKLVGLLEEKQSYGTKEDCIRKQTYVTPISNQLIADHLLANGVLVTPETGIGDLSDGYHTFNELYHHRAVLFSVICNSRPDIAWKSKLHDTGDMFEGMFIVGIETPQGQATYHYDIEPYWDMFKVKELEHAPKWDGHTPQEAIERIGSLSITKRGEWIKDYPDNPLDGEYHCSLCNDGIDIATGEETPIDRGFRHCPNCGAEMRGADK